jgi:hypothetical protein
MRCDIPPAAADVSTAEQGDRDSSLHRDAAHPREVHGHPIWGTDGQGVPAGLVAPMTRSGLNQCDEALSSDSTRDRIDRAILSTG